MPRTPPKNATGPFRYRVRILISGNPRTHVCLANNSTDAIERVQAAYSNCNVEEIGDCRADYLGMPSGVKVPLSVQGKAVRDYTNTSSI